MTAEPSHPDTLPSTHALPLLDEDELRACAPGPSAAPDDDRGFGALETARGPLPLRAMHVRARVVGLTSHLMLRQTFANPHDVPIEATYVFPLPDRAAATRFRMEVQGRVVAGRLEERARARATYDAAIAAGRRAAITEEDRAGVFTVRVGNLMPGEDATVELVLTGPLSWVDGEATFRFPLVVAPRYVPGTPLPGGPVGDGVQPDTDLAPDASRISPPVLLPGFPNPVRLSLEVAIEKGLAVRGLRSALHAVVEETRAGAQVVRLRPGERLDRDFVLRFSYGDGEGVGSTAVAGLDAPVTSGEGAAGVEAHAASLGGVQGDGTWSLTIVPPAGLAARQRPRDVAIVLDRSGSMMGWKMVCARRAAARIVDALGDEDRFALLAFDHEVEAYRSKAAPAHAGGPGDQTALVPATDRERFRAVEWLAGLDARGGTVMAEPLEYAAALLAASASTAPLALDRRSAGDAGLGRDRVLVLVTDGQVADEDHLLRRLEPALRGSRVFTLGIDRAVNAAFLARLASVGGGFSELVETEDRLDEVMGRVRRMIGAPVLTELRVHAEGFDVLPDTQVPARIPDLVAGVPVVVAGRFRGALGGRLRITGARADGSRYEHVVPVAPSTAGEALLATWARARIRDLEDRYAVGDRDPEALAREIVATSLRASVLSRFTAFVAVDERVVNVAGRLEKVVQPVEAPSGWGAHEGARESEAGAAFPVTGSFANVSSGPSPRGRAPGAPCWPRAEVPSACEPSVDDRSPAPPVPSPRSYTPAKGGSASRGESAARGSLGRVRESVTNGRQAEVSPVPSPNARTEPLPGPQLDALRERATRLLERLRAPTFAQACHAAPYDLVVEIAEVLRELLALPPHCVPTRDDVRLAALVSRADGLRAAVVWSDAEAAALRDLAREVDAALCDALTLPAPGADPRSGAPAPGASARRRDFWR